MSVCVLCISISHWIVMSTSKGSCLQGVDFIVGHIFLNFNLNSVTKNILLVWIVRYATHMLCCTLNAGPDVHSLKSHKFIDNIKA